MLNEISATQLKAKLDHNEDVQLVDVREDMEFEYCNLGGDHIPLGELPKQVDKISRDKQVVMICHHGFRSAQAIQFLTQRYGYTNLYNLKGGIHAWAQEVDPSMPTY
ncbi:MAG: rhodanese [Hymenobacteraceae bacterium]|nr:rhodanese [Hymenobacteraceae bacterium]MDX5395413.1 rhodanese [Hymenobacteraceae bacterium]MDX5443013.1 rhodanese [Hymenobacteraceae bacterium]MDX5511462.1 rhodanese [Hymenobacteraceae bacterium]